MAKIELTDEEQIMVVAALNAYMRQNERLASEFASSDDADSRPLGSLYSRLAMRAKLLVVKIAHANV